MKKGHAAYLAHIVDTRAPRDDPNKVSIICKYMDVFSEELNGVLPQREIEFTVEIVQGTTLISLIHYCMAPSEL